MRSIMREAHAMAHARVAPPMAACALVIALALGAASARGQDATPADTPPAPQAAASEPAAAPRTEASRIEAAVRQLRADPLISGVQKGHQLRFKDDDEKPRPKPKDDGWLAWMRSLGHFLNDTSRLLVYGLAIVLVAVLAVSAHRFLSLRGARRRPALAGAVSHVRDLDVRPESLPDDIGAAAWALWQAGDVGAALSLLYRGALSRLIHRHAVPIAASTTEGECIELARDRLEPGALRYLSRLVLAWQAVVYGRRTLSTAMGETLCTGFAAQLDAPATPASSTGEAPA
jgi:hypothetical protein